MVCSSIGYGGIDQISDFYLFLGQQAFDVVDHFMDKGIDYTTAAHDS
jgi:hypothetical protein